MKKFLLFALALLLAFVTVSPASAQHRGRRNGPVYYNDGYHGTYVERSVHQTQGLVNGIIGELGYGYGGYGYRGGYYDDYGYDYRYGRGYRYGRHETRNILLGTAAVVGGIWAIDKLTNHRDNGPADNGSASEEPSKCFERIVKAAKKQGVPVDPNQVMAVCSGQPLQQPEPERMSERASGNVEEDIAPVPEGYTPTPTTAPHVYRGAFRENGRLCNDNDRPLTILINGQVVGVLAPGAFVTLSRLPAGQLSYRY